MVSQAASDIREKKTSSYGHVFISLPWHPGEELLARRTGVCLTIRETNKPISKVAAPSHTPNSRPPEFSLLHTLATIGVAVFYIGVILLGVRFHLTIVMSV